MPTALLAVERPAEHRVQRMAGLAELKLQEELAEHRDTALLITEPQERSFWVEIAMTKVEAEAAVGSAVAVAEIRAITMQLYGAVGVVEAAQAT